LIGVVVERVGATGWVLDPDAIMQITPGPIIITFPLTPPYSKLGIIVSKLPP
jgi:hypothetical protein